MSMLTSKELAEALKRAKYAQYMRSIGYTLHPDNYGDMRHLAELADEIDRLQDRCSEFEANLTIAERQVTEARTELDKLRGSHETCEQPPMPFKDWAADIRTVSMQQTIHAYKNKIRKLEYQLACRPSEKAAPDETGSFGLCPKHRQMVETGCLACEALANTQKASE